MSKLDKDTVVENFTKAYKKANGKAPTIEAKGGWYSVDGGKNMRLAQLEEETGKLAGASATKAEKPKAKKEDKASKPAAKEEKTSPKKAEKKKQAPKKSTKAKKPASTFSVKDFYTQQIQEANPGAKAPR